MPSQNSDITSIEYVALVNLKARTSWSMSMIDAVAKSCTREWRKKTGTGEMLVLRKWLMTSVRHLYVILTLADSVDEHDLIMVGKIHHRQIFEIMLQVRYFLKQDSEKESVAEKISAWGCVDYLEQLEQLKDHSSIKGYGEMEAKLASYDKDLITLIKKERRYGKKCWFGKNFNALAANVSKNGEELPKGYKIISAEAHGTYDMTLGISHSQSGEFDFSGYSDKATLYKWAAELVEDATRCYVGIWNEVAEVVGASQIEILE